MSVAGQFNRNPMAASSGNSPPANGLSKPSVAMELSRRQLLSNEELATNWQSVQHQCQLAWQFQWRITISRKFRTPSEWSTESCQSQWNRGAEFYCPLKKLVVLAPVTTPL